MDAPLQGRTGPSNHYIPGFVYTVWAMAFRFIHSADWQIGKVFRFLDSAEMGRAPARKAGGDHAHRQVRRGARRTPRTGRGRCLRPRDSLPPTHATRSWSECRLITPYSGTHETDSFQTRGTGTVLLVEIDGPRELPQVNVLPTGQYRWESLDERVEDLEDVDLLEHRLRNLTDDLNHTLVDLRLSGALSLADLQHFEERIVEGAAAALYHLRIDCGQLFPEPTDDDLDSIDPGGIARAAADRLRALVEAGGATSSSPEPLFTDSTSSTKGSNRGNDEAAQKRLADAESQAEQMNVTDESLHSIRQVAEIADQASARLTVAATRINFDIPSDRIAGIEAGGAPLTDSPKTVEAVEPLEIVIPDRGRFLIEPAIADRDQLLRAEQEAMSEQQLAEAPYTALQALTEQQQTVSRLEEEWSDSTRSQLDARITRLENAIRQRESSRVELRLEIVRLRERIEAHDGAGIDEAIERTQHQLEQATRRRERLEREVEVLDLLVDTLRAAESEARERYLEPAVSRVHPYLQMLFSNAEIGMDEDLNITGISRLAGYEESFDHLSMGTQEQIAVLVRLAFAEMLVDQGAPAAVVLDDALVFSDDRRMRLMFDILSHAAQRVQIVVFTCREQLFEGLGAHQLRLTPGDPESLRSA